MSTGVGAGILAGYAVELDIFNSGPCDPGNGNHAGVDLLSSCSTNGGVPSPIATSSDLYTSPDPTNPNDHGVGDIGDGNTRSVTLTFLNGQMSVSIYDPTTGLPVQDSNLQNVTLSGYVPGTPYYIGFGGGSGSNGQASRIEISNVSVTFTGNECL